MSTDSTAETDEEAALPVAETFYSIQGEGPHCGIPAVFLRVAGCNLLCGAPENPDADQEELEPNEDAGATWVCDTIDVWRSGERLTATDIEERYADNGWLEPLRDGRAHLILTGGEPLQRQEAITAVLDQLRPRYVEVETNGTIEPTESFDEAVDYYNVSMKLSNSGMSTERRLVDDAIEFFRVVGPHRAMFKFVVGDSDDIAEILNLATEYTLLPEQISLMPAGASRDELSETYPLVADLCKSYGFRFSPRLHITLWNQQTGV